MPADNAAPAPPASLPYFLSPRDYYEARFGKAVLLTDAELGIILTALGECNPWTDDTEDRVAANLFPKLLELILGSSPYESLPIRTAKEESGDV